MTTLGHFFVSYSRADRRIARDFRRFMWDHGAPTWMDEDLAPGTLQWTQDLRNALDRSIAVIALCSRSAAASEFIPNEIQIALGKKLNVIPIWIDGENWSDSAPVMLVGSQSIDARKPDKTFAGNLVSALFSEPTKRQFNPVKDWRCIYVDYEGGELSVDLRNFPTIGSVLTEVFVKLLEGRFKPFTYGVDWVVSLSLPGNLLKEGRSMPLLWLPAEWAANPNQPVAKIREDWQHQSAITRPGPDNPRLRVVDLREFHDMRQTQRLASGERRSGFLGFKCGASLVKPFLKGGHPKSIAHELDDLSWQHDSAPSVFPETCFEFVTPANDYFHMRGGRGFEMHASHVDW